MGYMRQQIAEESTVLSILAKGKSKSLNKFMQGKNTKNTILKLRPDQKKKLYIILFV